MITSSHLRLKRDIIRRIAKRYNFKRISNFNRHQLTFKNHRGIARCGPVTVNINCEKEEIITSLKHYKYLDTSHLKRKAFSHNFLEKIFRNPRVHTGRGNYVDLKDEIGPDVCFYLRVQFVLVIREMFRSIIIKNCGKEVKARKMEKKKTRPLPPSLLWHSSQHIFYNSDIWYLIYIKQIKFI